MSPTSTRRISRHWGRALVIPVFLAGAFLAACGEDAADADTETPVESTAATETATETTATTAEATEEAETPEATEEAEETEGATGEAVVVEAFDYGFNGLPEMVEAGTQLALTNSSETELHELVAIRLPDDEERSVEELLALPEEELMALFASEPATVLLVNPGSDEVIPAVGDGTLAEAGRYAIICAIPEGADPEEYLSAAAASEGGPPQVEGGPPHFALGMFAELTVE